MVIDGIARAAALAAIASLGGPAATAQTTPAPLRVEPFRGGVYWVKGGSGANTGIVIGRKDVIVIDAKMTEESSKAMLSEIAKSPLIP